MFAKIKDDLVPFAPGYSPGRTIAVEGLPWAGRADLQKMVLKGVKPYFIFRAFLFLKCWEQFQPRRDEKPGKDPSRPWAGKQEKLVTGKTWIVFLVEMFKPLN